MRNKNLKILTTIILIIMTIILLKNACYALAAGTFNQVGGGGTFTLGKRYATEDGSGRTDVKDNYYTLAQKLVEGSSDVSNWEPSGRQLYCGQYGHSVTSGGKTVWNDGYYIMGGGRAPSSSKKDFVRNIYCSYLSDTSGLTKTGNYMYVAYKITISKTEITLKDYKGNEKVVKYSDISSNNTKKNHFEFLSRMAYVMHVGFTKSSDEILEGAGNRSVFSCFAYFQTNELTMNAALNDIIGVKSIGKDGGGWSGTYWQKDAGKKELDDYMSSSKNYKTTIWFFTNGSSSTQNRIVFKSEKAEDTSTDIDLKLKKVGLDSSGNVVNDKLKGAKLKLASYNDTECSLNINTSTVLESDENGEFKFTKSGKKYDLKIKPKNTTPDYSGTITLKFKETDPASGYKKFDGNSDTVELVLTYKVDSTGNNITLENVESRRLWI